MKDNKVEERLSVRIIPPSNQSRFEYLNDEAVVKLTAFLYNHTEFLVYVASILYECKNAQEFHNSSSLSDFYLENYGDDLTQEQKYNNDEFIRLLHSFYSKSGNQGKFSNLRGAVLERLTINYVSSRYLHNQNIYFPIDKNYLFDNCYLDIDCKVEIPSADWKTINPIDLAGWNSSSLTGEAYECKIKIYSMDYSDNEIVFELDKICEGCTRINNFNVGVVTFSSVEGIKYYFEFLNNSEKNNSNVKLYGRNNIEDLKEII